jgi:hypothetical protein
MLVTLLAFVAWDVTWHLRADSRLNHLHSLLYGDLGPPRQPRVGRALRWGIIRDVEALRDDLDEMQFELDALTSDFHALQRELGR